MKRKRRPLMGGKGLVSRVVAGVAAVGLLAASLVAVDLATDAVPASAAPINCTSATQSIVNQASVVNADGTTYTNRLEFFNTATGAMTPFADLSAATRANAVTRQTNGLGVDASGTGFYFVDFNQAPGGSPNIYKYDAAADTLTTTPAPPLGTTDDNAQVRRGGVNLKTGVYYYSTTRTTDPRVHNLYALNPAGETWYVGTVTTEQAGSSGDLAFDSEGRMYFVVGTNN